MQVSPPPSPKGCQGFIPVRGYMWRQRELLVSLPRCPLWYKVNHYLPWNVLCQNLRIPCPAMPQPIHIHWLREPVSATARIIIAVITMHTVLASAARRSLMSFVQKGTKAAATQQGHMKNPMANKTHPGVHAHLMLGSPICCCVVWYAAGSLVTCMGE